MKDAATQAQVDAAAPGRSTWLSANAGSGKTRVLTDRVARLLLAGTDPGRILCLTYTKAAASEMQNRLFRRLGEWAMLEDAPLRTALDQLGVEGAPGPDVLASARRLFARAIETPGGLKIQTIHSFCASLLRRFPLEAHVTPQFVEMEDRAAAMLRQEVVDEIALGPGRAEVDALARLWTGEDFAALTAEVVRHREGFSNPASRDDLLALFDLPAGLTRQDILNDVFLGGEADLLAALCPALAAGTATDAKAGAKLAGLSLQQPDWAALDVFEDVFLTGSSAKEPFTAKLDSFPNKSVRTALGLLSDPLRALMLRVEAARPRRIALRAVERSHILHAFAGVFLPEYDRRKGQRGWLDFDDLIRKARDLLTDPSVAQWVLFRLDGGIDHILVDEAQDTSPEQWRVIELLAQEFTTGTGARSDRARTIFVVGDKKQSIYSFQGADLTAFDAMRRHFRDRLTEVRIPLGEMTLEYSFRSAVPILRAVDSTFADPAVEGLGGAPTHQAFKVALPGRVDLWPLVAPGEKEEDRDWLDPLDLVTAEHHDARLARSIAAEIRRLIDARTPIPTDTGARPLTEGDVLILVRRRSTLFQQIIAACKAEKLAIAGADRLQLAEELAIRDLSALLSFLATPEDSLSLAAALRSPLFGWGEGQLYDLAAGREERHLWPALRRRRDEFPETMAILDDLRGQADFLRPFDLVERLLTRHDGRRRLIARLGEEAEDGIDAFLAQALAYERTEVPGLTGFLAWLNSGQVEVKRQMDAASNRIRVMTVHGAKGLEAPLVILPDTGPRRLDIRDQIWTAEGTPVWQGGGRDMMPPALGRIRDDLARRQDEESRRLLYVAMTRAEKWLIVCGTGDPEKAGDSWHDLIAKGIGAAEGLTRDPLETPAGPGLRLHRGDWPDPVAQQAPAPEVQMVLPDWTQRAAVAPEHRVPLSPSALGGAKALPGDGTGLSEEEAMQRGTMLHLLLENLPRWPAAGWQQMGRDLLSQADPPPTEEEMDALLDEAVAVLSNPALDFLFAPETLAEVAVSADLGGRRMLGTIDRLIVTADRILAVDFKSNAIVPATPDDVPDGLLRQMGAYGQALVQIYPDRRVETAILWTRTGALMPLPPQIVEAALRAATTA